MSSVDVEVQRNIHVYTTYDEVTLLFHFSLIQNNHRTGVLHLQLFTSRF